MPVLRLCIVYFYGIFQSFYRFVYFPFLNAPAILWALIIALIFAIHNFGPKNFFEIINNTLLLQKARRQKKLDQCFFFFSSMQGILSLAAISEVIVMLNIYNTAGSIFWMCATFALVALLQVIEISFSTKHKTTCILQYALNKLANKGKSKLLLTFMCCCGIVYLFCTISVSLFGGIVFQIEQFNNFKHNDFIVAVSIIGILLSLNLKKSVKKVSTPVAISGYLLMSVLCIMYNSESAIAYIIKIFEEAVNKNAILPGVVSGLVISFARYLSRPCMSNVSYNYEMLLSHINESLFTIFLIILSGVSFVVSSQLLKYLFFFYIGYFALSLMIVDFKHSKSALVHLSRNKRIIKPLVFFLIIFAVFVSWIDRSGNFVDIIDRISIALFSLNIFALFFLKNEIKLLSSKEQYNAKNTVSDVIIDFHAIQKVVLRASYIKDSMNQFR